MTTTVSLTIHGPNLRGGPAETFHVHTAECRDNGREVKRYGSQNPWTGEFASVLDVVESTYPASDFQYDASDPDEVQPYLADFHFAPCVPKTFTHPTPNTQEDRMTKTTPTETTTTEPTPAPTFEWTETPSKLLTEYLKDQVSKDPDAPHRGLPYITQDDVLRVRPTSWVEWLTARGINPPKRAALAVLKDAGLVQKSTTLPAVEGQPKGKALGLYTGPAPRGTSRLPRYTPPAKVVKSAKAKVTETSGAIAQEDADQGPAN